MYLRVNGTRLYFDVDGAGLVADGPVMREKPVLIVLHGGPGADHSIHKPEFGQLADAAQVIYLDHRGNGRSDEGTARDWNLAQWADDLQAFIEALGLSAPIVYGASFGGVVAQTWATRHPGQARGLILAATAARTDFDAIFAAFDRIGGTHAGDIARAYWSAPTPEGRAEYFRQCLPLYSVRPPDPDRMARMIVRNPVAMHYNGPMNEQGRFDLTTGLAKVRCPVLILSGDRDPIMPQVFSDQIEAALVAAPVAHRRLPDCGHLQTHDRPDLVFPALRVFLSTLGAA